MKTNVIKNVLIIALGICPIEVVAESVIQKDLILSK